VDGRRRKTDSEDAEYLANQARKWRLSCNYTFTPYKYFCDFVKFAQHSSNRSKTWWATMFAGRALWCDKPCVRVGPDLQYSPSLPTTHETSINCCEETSKPSKLIFCMAFSRSSDLSLFAQAWRVLGKTLFLSPLWASVRAMNSPC